MSRTILHLNWNGPAVSATVKKETRAAMDETLLAAVTAARSFVAIDTGALYADITVTSRPGQGRDQGGRYSSGMQGSFGAPNIPYAIWQEIGTAKMPAHPYLRPAAELEFPRLAGRLQRRLGG